MSLHIFLNKNGKENIDDFLSSFKSKLNIVEQEKCFSLNGYLGLIKVNDDYDAKIFGDIEVNAFNDHKKVSSFFDLLKLKIIDVKQLDEFFSNNKNFLSKAYIDIDGDGEENPLDIMYEYDSRGESSFRKVIRAIEILAEDSEEYEALFDKVKEYERSNAASLFWNNEKAREMFLRIAKKNNIIAAEGSFKLYASDKEKLRKYYIEVIDQIIKPVFKVPSLKERIEKI